MLEQTSASTKDSLAPAATTALIAVCVLAWVGNYPVGKWGFTRISPLTLASFRMELAALVMLLAIFLRMLFRRASGAHEKNVGAQTKATNIFKKTKVFLYLGLFNVILNQGCFTVGLAYTTVGHSALLVSIGPILVLLLARAKNLEPLTARKFLGMLLGSIGVILLAVEHGLSFSSITLRGDLITLFGTLGYALFTVFAKEVSRDYDPLEINAFTCLAGAVLALPVALWQASQITQLPAWSNFGLPGWGAISYMAVFSSALSYTAFLWLLRYKSASRVGALSYLMPIVPVTYGALFLGEAITPILILGGSLILAGIYVIEF